MTLERYIGYSGFFLIFFHAIPFSQPLVNTITIVLAVGLILAATYLRWKKRIHTYMNSHGGNMSIPRFFENLEQHKTGPKKTTTPTVVDTEYSESGE